MQIPSVVKVLIEKHICLSTCFYVFLGKALSGEHIVGEHGGGAENKIPLHELRNGE